MTPEELRKRRRERSVKIDTAKCEPWPQYDREEIAKITAKVRQEMTTKADLMFPDKVGFAKVREKYISYETMYKVQCMLTPNPMPYWPSWCD